jgi:hypothetical protein
MNKPSAVGDAAILHNEFVFVIFPDVLFIYALLPIQSNVNPKLVTKLFVIGSPAPHTN